MTYGPTIIDPDSGEPLQPTSTYSDDAGHTWDYYLFTGDQSFRMELIPDEKGEN